MAGLQLILKTCFFMQKGKGGMFIALCGETYLKKRICETPFK